MSHVNADQKQANASESTNIKTFWKENFLSQWGKRE